MPSLPKTTFIPYNDLISDLLEAGHLTSRAISETVFWDRSEEEIDNTKVSYAYLGVYLTVDNGEEDDPKEVMTDD